MLLPRIAARVSFLAVFWHLPEKDQHGDGHSGFEVHHDSVKERLEENTREKCSHHAITTNNP